MHILHVIDSLAIGGAERMLVDIANATVAGDHKVSVCITRTGLDLVSELHQDIQLLILNRQARIEIDAMRIFANYVTSTNVSVLHVHGRSSFAFVATVKAVRLINLPIVLHDHYGIEIDNAIPLWFRLWGKQFVTQYVGVYNKLAQWALKAGLPKSKVQTIGNALELDRLKRNDQVSLRVEFGIPSGIAIGIVICGLRREKGIDILIESIAEVSVDKPFVIFIIGGDRDRSYAKECREKITSLGLNDRIVFLGERADAARFAQDADFALMPSRSESGPLVMIEYLAAGLPVVAFKVGEISSKMASLDVMGIVQPGDVYAFTTEIEKLLNIAPLERKARGLKGIPIAIEHFSIQSKLPQWYCVYNKALQQGLY